MWPCATASQAAAPLARRASRRGTAGTHLFVRPVVLALVGEFRFCGVRHFLVLLRQVLGLGQLPLRALIRDPLRLGLLALHVAAGGLRRHQPPPTWEQAGRRPTGRCESGQLVRAGGATKWA